MEQIRSDLIGFRLRPAEARLFIPPGTLDTAGLDSTQPVSGWARFDITSSGSVVGWFE